MERPDASGDGPPQPAHERVYRRLRDMILFGDLAPGQPVTIQGLVARFGVSMTPVREAIRRLTAEGALEFRGNRRVSVPVLDAASFEELALARTAIEPRLVEMAARRAGPSDIAALRRADDALNAAIALGDAKAYMRHNHAFHFALYRLAEAAILLQLAETLWLRFGPLYRVISGRYGTARLIDKHDEALQALARGDAAAAQRAIRDDIEQGFALVRDSLHEAEGGGENLIKFG